MQLAARIEQVEAIAGIEVNISCPNVKAGGMVFGVDPAAAFRVVRGGPGSNHQASDRKAVTQCHRHH